MMDMNASGYRVFDMGKRPDGSTVERIVLSVQGGKYFAGDIVARNPAGTFIIGNHFNGRRWIAFEVEKDDIQLIPGVLFNIRTREPGDGPAWHFGELDDINRPHGTFVVAPAGGSQNGYRWTLAKGLRTAPGPVPGNARTQPKNVQGPHSSGRPAEEYRRAMGFAPDMGPVRTGWNDINPPRDIVDRSEGMLSGGTFIQKLERETMKYLRVEGDPDMNWIGMLLQEKLQQARHNDAKSGTDLDDKVDALNEGVRAKFRKDDMDRLTGIMAELRENLEELIDDDE